MILEIELSNFRSISTGKVVLTKGINFIHGLNGAGKSTFLDAIAFALYGSEWARKSGVKIQSFIKLGRAAAKISLTMEGEDGKYVVQRVISQNKTDTHQTYVNLTDGKGSRTVAARDKDVTALIERVLGVDADLFARLLYIRQGEIRDILEANKAGKNRLDAVIKIDALNKLQDSVMKDARRDVERRIDSITGEIKAMERQLETSHSRLEDIRKQKEAINRELNTIEGEIAKLGSELSLIEGEIAKLEEYERRAYALEAQLDQVEEEIETLRVKLGEAEQRGEELRAKRSRLEEVSRRLDELRKEKEKYDSLRKREEELRKRFEEAEELKRKRDAKRRELERIEEELRREEKEVEELRKLVNELEEKEEEADYEAEKANNELRELEEKGARMSAELKHIEMEIELLRTKGGTTCPVCGKPLTDAEASDLTRRISEEADELRSKLKENTAAREEVKDRVRINEKKLREISSEVSKGRGRIENGEMRIKQLSEELQRLGEELRTLESGINELSPDSQEYIRVKNEMDGLRASVDEYYELSEEHRYLASELSKYGTNEEEDIRSRLENDEAKKRTILASLNELKAKLSELANQRAKAEEAKKKLNDANMRKAEASGALALLMDVEEKTVAEVDELNKRLNNTSNELGKLRESLYLLNMLNDSIEKAKPLIRKTFIDFMNEELRESFTSLRHKESYVDIRMDGDYDVYVRRSDGREVSFDALSMGEKNLVALIFRYAMAKVILGHIPLMMMDEPTEHLDSEHRAKVASWLRDISSNIDVMLITSHVDSFENSADNVIRIEAINPSGDTTVVNA